MWQPSDPELKMFEEDIEIDIGHAFSRLLYFLSKLKGDVSCLAQEYWPRAKLVDNDLTTELEWIELGLM
ncbi:MAG: hypothetical protein ACRCYY_20820 [Trueperaceae bacterium]